MELTLENIVGKTILVGLTYYATSDDRLLGREQYSGTVVSTAPDKITIRREDGSLTTIPADLRSTRPAPRGEYRLRSTGEIVADPDLLSTWNIYRNE